MTVILYTHSELIRSDDSLGLVWGEAGDGDHSGLCSSGRVHQTATSGFPKGLGGTKRLRHGGTLKNTHK